MEPGLTFKKAALLMVRLRNVKVLKDDQIKLSVKFSTESLVQPMPIKQKVLLT